MCTKGSGTNSVKPPVSRLQVAQRQQVPRPVPGRLDMAEHDRGGRAQAEPMRGCAHASHCAVFTLSGQMIGADLVVEDLRGRARQRAEPAVLQPAR